LYVHSFHAGNLLKMKCLIACEYSGRLRDAMIDRGHNAWSCDLLPSEGEHKNHHLQCDVFEVLDSNWDMVIAFPPCTHLASSGARWFSEKREDGRQQAGTDFFMEFVAWHQRTLKPLAIENPVGIMSTHYRKPDQIIHPWMFGHGETKATCLWLHGLPILNPTNIVEGREPRIWKMPPSEDRAKLRSLTYVGIAQAMATQWGNARHTEKTPNKTTPDESGASPEHDRGGYSHAWSKPDVRS